MNKQLLSFTALCAVGVLGAAGTAVAQKASKPTISVGGYYNAGVRFTDNADAVGGRDTGGFAAFNDSEIHFKISGMLDNGIKIGGRWELEGDDADAFMDEAYVSFSGGFGSVRLGQEDGAAHLMVVGYGGSWATQNGLNLNFDIDELVPDPSGFTYRRAGVRMDLGDSDDPKITYFSPRFGGFQIGGSYARDVTTAGPTGTNVNADAENAQPRGAGAGEDWYSVAANFDRKFGNFRVGVGVGYVTEKSSLTGSGTDPETYGIGALVDFGPVRVSAAYTSTDDYGANDGDVYDIGVRYSFGAHRIGLAYHAQENEGAAATAGDDEVGILWATHSMALGPGVSWKNTIAWADWDGEGTAATADNDGWGVATHIALSF